MALCGANNFNDRVDIVRYMYALYIVLEHGIRFFGSVIHFSYFPPYADIFS